ncbi:MAG: hypothetical protein HUJ76_08685 [Parasporobacterium sp.]|nr:hypothetical protein [Parasporobacterium sp.]
MSNLLYDALMLGRNKKVEEEEYFIAGGKQAASYGVKSESIEIFNVISDGQFTIELYQDVPGYFEIEILCSDNFIIFDKKVITSDEFIDGRFEFRFMVISDRLHNGRNYSMITFASARQQIDVPVTVENRIRVKISDSNPRSRVLELESLYVDLHMGKLESREWAVRSLELLSDDNVTGDDTISLSLMLYKAQAYMVIGDDVHARNNIEYVGTQIPKLENRNYELYCYFIYTASLYEEVKGVKNSGLCMNPWRQRDDREGIVPFSAEAFHHNNIMDKTSLQKVRWVYYHHPCWNILCMLLYMDPYFRTDKRFTLNEMRRLYNEVGERSRVMYMEALKLLPMNVKAVMSVPDGFTIQLYSFALKYDSLTKAMADRFAHILYKEGRQAFSDEYKTIIIRLLRASYDRYPEENILKVLIRILIDGGIRDKDCHRYFDRAVRDGESGSDVFDYFIFTMDKTSGEPVPPPVMKYFLDHTEYLYEYRKYFYSNLIRNDFSYGDLYKQGLAPAMKFAEYQMAQGINDELMSVIYLNILKNARLTDNMRGTLYEILCTRQVECFNSRMHSVLVFHKELQVYQESILNDGKAYVRIYTPDALILFKDRTGNIFRKIDYDLHQMINEREYIDVCLKDAPINKCMLMGDTLPILRAYKSPVEILEFFSARKIVGQFRRSYEQELLKNTIFYYAKNSRDEKVYDEIIKLKAFNLTPDTRGVIIGIMLRRGLIDEAFDEVRMYGSCDLSPEQMAELASEYIKIHGTAENDVLTYLCEAGYEASGLNEYIFEYLYINYTGSLELLAQIYRACNVHHMPAGIIEERILEQAITIGRNPETVSFVFRRYYESDGNRYVIDRYIRFRAEHFLHDLMTGETDPEFTSDMSFFDYMERDLIQGMRMNDECLIAYLLYRTAAEGYTDRQLRCIESVLKDLVSRGKMLEEFKYYSRYFELPATLVNNIIVSAFSEEAGVKPGISFEISGPSGVIKGEEDMEEIFRHCYVKYFTLFYGEKVVFSMNGKHSNVILYSDLAVIHDGSRYAGIDDIIRYYELHDKDSFHRAIEDFYIKDRLIDILIR